MKHQVFEHKLPSGAAGLVVHVPGSAVVNLRVVFRSGFQFTSRKTYEVPHIMEHLLATVTQRRREPNAFMIEAQKNGAYVNASTSADTNEYIYECAKFELSRIVDLLEEQVCEPLFAAEAFAAEVSNVREELMRNSTQHMSVCSVRLAEQAFPQAWMDYEARIEQLADIELEKMEDHYRKTHTAANVRFYVAGNFPDGGEAIAKRFEKIFARLPTGRRLETSRAIGRGSKQAVVTQRDIGQIYYRSGIYFGELTESERATLTVLRMLLVGGMGSRVLGEARRRGLAYSVGAVGHSEPGNSSFGFAGYVTPEHATALFEVMQRSLEALGSGECTPKELAAAQDLMVGSITRSTQTAGDILQWYIERYEDEGVIRDFDRGLANLRSVQLADVGVLGQRLVATKVRGLSLVGRVDEAQAADYVSLFS